MRFCRTIALIVFLFLFSFPFAYKANKDTLSRPTKNEHFYLGLGLNTQRLNSKLFLISPLVQIYPVKKICIYAGPIFLIPIDTTLKTENLNYRAGMTYSFINNKKLWKYIRAEYTYIKYDCRRIEYDMATPNIPIKATTIEINTSKGLNLNFGAKYIFKNRYYIAGDAGLRLGWNTVSAYPLYHSSKKADEDRIHRQLYYLFTIETGICF